VNKVYPRLTNPKPIVSFLAELYNLNEMSFPDDFTPTEQDVEDSINLLYFQQSVSVYTLETNTCTWNITVGYKFVKSILMFLNNSIAYPKDGFLEDFCGKTFSGIHRSLQRRISSAKVPMCLCHISNGTDHIHEAIINSASRISQP
jgi:hypothetical protein